jgi:hypothetical protein
MKRLLALAVLAVFAGPLLGQQAEPTSPPRPSSPSSTADPQMAPTPVPTLVDNIIKLWKANLSEDFLKKYISSTDSVKDLTAEDIVKLRNAGLPENLISFVTERKQLSASVPAAGAAPAPMPAAVATATPTPTPTIATTGRWEGLGKRNGGLVMFKSRWDPGVLEFKEESLRWTDARDVTKNVLLPAKQMTEQQLTCLKKAGGNECFEWVVKAKGQEYRFRDTAWERGENAKVAELFAFFRSLYPNLVSSQVPVDSK